MLYPRETVAAAPKIFITPKLPKLITTFYPVPSK